MTELGPISEQSYGAQSLTAQFGCSKPYSDALTLGVSNSVSGNSLLNSAKPVIFLSFSASMVLAMVKRSMIVATAGESRKATKP